MNTTPPQPGKPPSDQSGTLSEAAVSQPPTPRVPSQDTAGVPSSSNGGDSTPPLDRIGDFAILRILGEGGMGTVYLAEDHRLRRKAAIKTLRRELAAKPVNRERFLREAQAAAAIEHDNVVPIWHVGEAADGSPFIAMPFLQGETLDDLMKREPILPPGLILKVAGEVAEGLSAAHDRGLIHRDIKPSNVWLEGDPAAPEPPRQVRRCKILDFGLARSVGGEDVQLTGSGIILGTPAYMAPEQGRGEAVDHRADLFSLGVMLFRMATGKSPFEGPTLMGVLTALATVTPPPARGLNPNVPPALSDLIGRLMCKDPAGRPRSAAEVAAEVRQVATDFQAGKPDPGGAPVPRGQQAWAVHASAANVSEETASVEVRPAPRPRAEAWRGRTPLLVALGLLALVSLGWRLTAVVLRVGSRTTAASLDADRKAAEYVLSVGGAVGVNELDREIKEIDDLPADAFRLTLVGLHENKKVSDATLAVFEGCKNLTVLSLSGTQVHDKGLAHFKDCKNLKSLWLNSTQVTDAGLAYFKGCKNLTQLGLQGTKVSDAGLSPFEGNKMTYLDLSRTQVGDTSLAHFKDSKHLTHLWLGGTKVSDAGLDNFVGLRDLTFLGLQETQVSDAGLANFKDCKNLTSLDLGGTKVSDAGLANFKDCKNLTLLGLQDTKVSKVGLAHFEECKSLTDLWLGGTQVGDAELGDFKNLKSLTNLDLEATKVSNAGLAHLEKFKKVTGLNLQKTKVGDEGMAHLKKCGSLMHLRLQKTKVTAAKIEELRKALPACKIEWDGGVIEPKAN